MMTSSKEQKFKSFNHSSAIFTSILDLEAGKNIRRAGFFNIMCSL